MVEGQAVPHLVVWATEGRGTSPSLSGGRKGRPRPVCGGGDLHEPTADVHGSSRDEDNGVSP